MGGMNFAVTRAALAAGKVGQVGTNTPVAIRMRYIGSGTITSVTIVTGTGLTNITSDGGTDAYTFATYTTVGALVDAINADGIFEAKVLDSLRSYASDDQFVDGAITASSLADGQSVYDISVDTSEAKYFAYRLTANRGFDGIKRGGHRVHLQEAVYYATLGAAAADSFQVYEINGTVETKILGELSVSATETTKNFASGEGRLSANDGNDLVVILKDGTSIADGTENLLQVVGVYE